MGSLCFFFWVFVIFFENIVLIFVNFALSFSRSLSQISGFDNENSAFIAKKILPNYWKIYIYIDELYHVEFAMSFQERGLNCIIFWKLYESFMMQNTFFESHHEFLFSLHASYFFSFFFKNYINQQKKCLSQKFWKTVWVKKIPSRFCELKKNHSFETWNRIASALLNQKQFSKLLFFLLAFDFFIINWTHFFSQQQQLSMKKIANFITKTATKKIRNTFKNIL